VTVSSWVTGGGGWWGGEISPLESTRFFYKISDPIQYIHYDILNG
jgi:hypothetical protein